jgi:hypothetical protein
MQRQRQRDQRDGDGEAEAAREQDGAGPDGVAAGQQREGRPFDGGGGEERARSAKSGS